MALKGDRQIDATEIGYFFNGTSDRGFCLSLSTGGSGIALDSASNVARVAASSSGALPLGVLLNDFVSIDRTRLPINWNKDQHASGDKCTLLRRGWIVTNALLGTIAPGQLAVLAESGNLRASAIPVSNSASTPGVGRFLTGKDEAGFARVEINL